MGKIFIKELILYMMRTAIHNDLSMFPSNINAYNEIQICMSIYLFKFQSHEYYNKIIEISMNNI